MFHLNGLTWRAARSFRGPAPKISGAITAGVSLAAASLLLALALFQSEPPARIAAGAFRLTSSRGEIVDSRALQGHAYAIFFGFTQCPAVCSTTLAQMANLVQELGLAASSFKSYFVTLDPERDTPAALNDFLASFEPAPVGLTGSAEEIAAAAKAFRVYHRKVRLEHGDYAIEHSTLVYLVDPAGRIFDYLSFDEPHDMALKKLKDLLDENARSSWRPRTLGDARK